MEQVLSIKAQTYNLEEGKIKATKGAKGAIFDEETEKKTGGKKNSHFPISKKDQSSNTNTLLNLISTLILETGNFNQISQQSEANTGLLSLSSLSTTSLTPGISH